ncbi:hypothetical protein V5O48_018359 [Marasmius crinis-equi]|uniref:Uncharacterized protein n=1 Tax=Marasmius crinis-equi TaxID=585013 RepID=A0ABR3ELK9_9AGAR
MEDPQSNGPQMIGEDLDLTGDTLKALKESRWNRELIHRLAEAATSSIPPQPAVLYGRDPKFWKNWFQSRIHALLRDFHRSRVVLVDNGNTSNSESNHSKRKAATKIDRLRKHDRRRGLSCIMLQASLERDDSEEVKRWAFAVRAIDQLTTDGMSDEEDGRHEGEPVKLVHGVDYRHPDFVPFFHDMDNVRSVETAIFDQGGKKRIPRTPSGRMDARTPPPGIPPQLIRPEYLEAMRRGDLPMVELGLDEESVSSYVQHAKKIGRKRSSANQHNIAVGSQSTQQPVVFFVSVLFLSLVAVVGYYSRVFNSYGQEA